MPPRAPSKLNRPSISQMRRMRRLRARFCASRSEMRSPAYSAIFLPRLKGMVAKQPRPLILDFPMVRPCASFIARHCTMKFHHRGHRGKPTLRAKMLLSVPFALCVLPFAFPLCPLWFILPAFSCSSAVRHSVPTSTQLRPQVSRLATFQ